MIVVFCGPTLSADEAAPLLSAHYAPPASQGDIYTAAREGARAIGLIDGYFERVPAVWHKEILWAMSQGVHVFGAASMGALRAAELEAFGMVGVGRVYEAYRDGVLEDDDEVAVTQGPGELGFLALSEAMVNVRATVASAATDGVIGADIVDLLLRVAKALHFSERQYDRILDLARQELDTAGAVETTRGSVPAFQAWLEGGRIDVKRNDALELIELLAATNGANGEPKEVDYSFQNTSFWQMLAGEVERRPMEYSPGVETRTPEGVLDELKLQGGEEYRWVRERATVRLLALELADSRGIEPGSGILARTLSDLRRQLDLADPSAFDEWREQHGLGSGALKQLVRDEARVGQVRRITSRRLDLFIRDQLKVENRYWALSVRSREKQIALASRGLQDPTLADAGISERALWEWYFGEERAPSAEEVQALAMSMDFPSARAFRRAVLREFLYQRASAGSTPPASLDASSPTSAEPP